LQIAIAKFEQLMEKALLLGEVENSELVALVVALLHELPGLPKQLIGDWCAPPYAPAPAARARALSLTARAGSVLIRATSGLLLPPAPFAILAPCRSTLTPVVRRLQLAYPSIFNYVQDSSTLPGHAISASTSGGANGGAGPSEHEWPRRRLMNRFLPSQESFNWASRYQSMLQDKIDPYAARLAGLAASRFHPDSHSGGTSDVGDNDGTDHAATGDGTTPKSKRRILERLGLGGPAAPNAEGTPSLVTRAWHDASTAWSTPASLRPPTGLFSDPGAHGGAAGATSLTVDGGLARAPFGGAHADATAGLELAARRLSPPHGSAELAQARSEYQHGGGGGAAPAPSLALEPGPLASPTANPMRGHGAGKYVGLADDADVV
jgi:hypothetical protein